MTKEQEFNNTARQALINSGNVNSNFSRKIMRKFKLVRLYYPNDEVAYDFSLEKGDIQCNSFTRYAMDNCTKRLVRKLLIKDFVAEKFPQIMIGAAVAGVMSLVVIDKVKHKAFKNQTQQNVLIPKMDTENMVQFRDAVNQQKVR